MARPIIGSVTIVSGGTSQVISTRTEPVISLIFRPRTLNAGNSYVNDSTDGGSSGGFEILPGEPLTVPIGDYIQNTGQPHTSVLTDWYVDGTTGDKVDFIALV